MHEIETNKMGFQATVSLRLANGLFTPARSVQGEKTQHWDWLKEGVVLLLTELLKNLQCQVYVDKKLLNSPSLQETLRMALYPVVR